MKTETKKWLNFLWAILAVGIFYLTSTLLALLGYQVIPQWLPIKQEQADAYMLIVDVIISIVLLALSFLAYRKLQENNTEQPKPAAWAITSRCLITGAAIFGLNTVLDMLLLPSGGGSKESLLSMILTAVIFAPLVEEFFFRGVVFKLLKRFKNGWIAIVLSALIFGIYHMDPYQALYTGILGLVLAIIYQRTKNIVYPIIIHMTNNALTCLVTAGIPDIAQKIIVIISVMMIIPALFFLITKPGHRRAVFRKNSQ